MTPALIEAADRMREAVLGCRDPKCKLCVAAFAYDAARAEWEAQQSTDGSGNAKPARLGIQVQEGCAPVSAPTVSASQASPSTPSADAPTREDGELPPDATPAELWAEIYRLRADAKGPDGYATWKEAAIAERLRAGAASREGEAREREVAWLIETPTGQYWCGGKCGWTPSPNLACRFARAEDAIAAREWLRIPPVDTRITEHIWLDTAPAEGGDKP